MHVFHNCLISHVEKPKYNGHCRDSSETADRQILSSLVGQPDLFFSRPLKKAASRVRSGARLVVEHLQIPCESLGSILTPDRSKIVHCA